MKNRAGSGDASAQYALGRAYETGSGIQKSPQQAALWYRKAADQGNAKAQNSLGVLYWMGEGVDKDKKEAVQWYRKAASQGDANAMFNLGAAYYNGEGVATNDTLALAWFLLSAEGGIPSGQEAAKRSEQEHQPWMFNDACLAIGEMYEKGADLPKNVDMASAWYKKAADRGNAQAQLNLALLAVSAKNYDDARRRCESAAKDRFPGGEVCLGYLYQHGLGVQQDLKAATKYYQLAARQGNRGALHSLVEIYSDGSGKKEDRQETFFLLIHYAERGDRQAVIDAQRLRNSMNDKERKDVQKKLPQYRMDSKQLDAILHANSQSQ